MLAYVCVIVQVTMNLRELGTVSVYCHDKMKVGVLGIKVFSVRCFLYALHTYILC